MFSFILLTLLLLSGRLQAGEQPLPAMWIPSTLETIHVDGRLTEGSWREAARVVLRDNHTGGQLAHPTIVRLIRRQDVLYVGFFCADDEAKAEMTKRDDELWREEAVEIFLDPTGEGREYLEIEVNPRGALYDGWVEYGPNIDFDRAKAFDLASVRVAAQVQRRGRAGVMKSWTCEIAIPLTELPAKIHGTFRLNLTRVDHIEGKHHYQAWSPTYRWFHAPEKFGSAHFR
ncbi:MAG: hypothetical protein A3G34_02020 [Candidatus Lindowbacteria bacterium RIFCSPLOWO2_12_FULL_62_27]|nr:MAG: hypothetical protein A3G34_02020 [Candidatus Lindowbacteria bacterium RIFCSPLOWO2_12_FULL_62_27]